MGSGATYWGNSEGRNDECDNKSGRPTQYPGSQGMAGMSKKPAAESGDKDSIKVPNEKKAY